MRNSCYQNNYFNNHARCDHILLYCYSRECWGHQVACRNCIVERFCCNKCLETAQNSYHPFDCAGGTVDKGIAQQSAALLEKMLTDVR